jgi:hypothetical protein
MGVTDIKTQRRLIFTSTQIMFFLLNQYKVHIISADLVQCARSVRVVPSTHCHRTANASNVASRVVLGLRNSPSPGIKNKDNVAETPVE